jgi:YhgE/Pip-like protein
MDAPPPLARASTLLAKPKLWLLPTLLSTLLAFALSLLYMGGIVSPEDDLRKLPVGLVNSDTGEPLPGQKQNLGTQIAESVMAKATDGGKIKWREMSRAQAQEQLDTAKVYGVLVIPPDFTESVGALAEGKASQKPTLTVLTNQAKGSVGASLASNVAVDVAERSSRTIGEQLLKAAPETDPTAKLVLEDPVRVVTEPGHPLGQRSGLGLTAFYYTLLIVLAGFMGANIIHQAVDISLGYADNELGPWHKRLPTVPISRTQTLVLKMVMTAGVSLLSASLLMLACVGILNIDAGHLPLLWLFTYCATLAVGIGVQAINAAFGGIGQLVAMFAFIVLGLPSSGATIPLQAVPGFYRFLSRFEPMRQLSDGVRAILYFDARGDAGLLRAWVMTGIGAAIGLAFGFLMTHYYDRMGHARMVPAPASEAHHASRAAAKRER